MAAMRMLARRAPDRPSRLPADGGLVGVGEKARMRALDRIWLLPRTPRGEQGVRANPGSLGCDDNSIRRGS